MGCGNSKAVRASDAPTEQVVIDDEGFPLDNGRTKTTDTTTTRASIDSLADKPGKARSSKVQVAPAIELEVVDRATKDRDVHSASSQDSGFDDNDNIITESTRNGEALAASDMPHSIGTDFMVTGAAFGSRNKLRDIDSAKSNQSSFSTQSTASAPSILERPKSRGGCAFDVTYEDARVTRPSRLQSLEKKRSGSNLTLEQLEKKLRAAERRRVEYETRIKAKMLQETSKLKKASTSLTREKTTLGNTIDSKEDKATENRRKHLENLRAKLKAKEAKAERVRANRELRRLEQEEALKTNRPTTAQAIAAH